MSVATLLARAENAIESAQLLLDEGFYEASVSRAYYAMFYAAEALLLSRALSASTHKGILTLLNKHFVKTGLLSDDYGKMFSRAAEKRQLADYADTFVLSEEEAVEVLRDAREFVSHIQKMLH